MIRYFWSHFFSILLAFVALAEWVCAAWLAVHVLGLRPGWPVHVLAPPAIYLMNRMVLGVRARARRSHSDLIRRVYTGVAFASIFGTVFLALVGALWGTAWAGVRLASTVRPDLSLEPFTQAAVMFGTAGLFGVAGAIAYGYGIGQRRLSIVELEVALAGLATADDGLRVVQISDLHLGQYMSLEQLAFYVERVNELDPDLVCITGDITDGLEHAPLTFPVLDRLRARLGVFAILGNHDMYTGADAVTEALRSRTAIRVLRDRVASVPVRAGRLYLLGLDDRGRDWAHGVRRHPVLEELVASIPQGEPYIVLSHRPDAFEHAARLGAGLTLAGHTHGGQLALPWFGARRPSLAHFITRYPRGTFSEGSSTLHVNVGLGVTGQPVRLATPREITVVTLRSQGEHLC